ncbi:coth protein-domain-containing protein [Spinellus fusiger]|nr:coth protein-domain-containing protein [Spinellus fusiger]
MLLHLLPGLSLATVTTLSISNLQSSFPISMRLLAYTGVISLAISAVVAADVQYSVVAFPQAGETVSVSVGGQLHPLTTSAYPNLFTGSAPFGDSYQYVLTSGGTNNPEAYQRALAKDATSTGNEFYGRSRTVYNVPSIPKAYNYIYPTLSTGMSKSNEVATIIMSVNQTALDAYNAAPTTKQPAALVSEMVYISNQEMFKFTGAGLSTSGQSTKDFSKQSWSLDFGKYNTDTSKPLLYGRSSVKLRAEETDMTLAREKLMLDCLAASGATTLSSSWVRVFINNQAYGLFLLMDEASTHFIENVLYGGDWNSPNVGPTYKGNAITPEQEGNLVYVGEDATLYSKDIYKLQDKGNNKSLNSTNQMQPLIDFTRRLSLIDPTKATNAQTSSDIQNLIDPVNTMIQLAMNYLSGSWDGFWIQASNYYLNQDLSTNKYTLITYDFDEVFGNGAENGLVTAAYTNYSRPDSKRPLVDLFLKSPYYNQQFQSIVTTIVKRFFKPSVINPLLSAWTDMLKDEMTWTRAIAGLSPGEKTTWTTEDFVTNMNTTAKGTMGIGQWITVRSAAICQQLNINDADDLPSLPAYTSGSYLDSNGKVVAGTNPSAGTSGNAGNAGNQGPNSKGSVLISSSYAGAVVAAMVVYVLI